VGARSPPAFSPKATSGQASATTQCALVGKEARYCRFQFSFAFYWFALVFTGLFWFVLVRSGFLSFCHFLLFGRRFFA